VVAGAARFSYDGFAVPPRPSLRLFQKPVLLLFLQLSAQSGRRRSAL
jgi:hypothetical protein